MKSKRWKRRNKHKGKAVLLWFPISKDWGMDYGFKPEPHRCLQEDYDKWRQSIYDRMD